jgi:hypothetical protein
MKNHYNQNSHSMLEVEDNYTNDVQLDPRSKDAKGIVIYNDTPGVLQMIIKEPPPYIPRTRVLFMQRPQVLVQDGSKTRPRPVSRNWGRSLSLAEGEQWACPEQWAPKFQTDFPKLWGVSLVKFFPALGSKPPFMTCTPLVGGAKTWTAFKCPFMFSKGWDVDVLLLNQLYGRNLINQDWCNELEEIAEEYRSLTHREFSRWMNEDSAMLEEIRAEAQQADPSATAASPRQEERRNQWAGLNRRPSHQGAAVARAASGEGAKSQHRFDRPRGKFDRGGWEHRRDRQPREFNSRPAINRGGRLSNALPV